MNPNSRMMMVVVVGAQIFPGAGADYSLCCRCCWACFAEKVESEYLSFWPLAPISYSDAVVAIFNRLSPCFPRAVIILIRQNLTRHLFMKDWMKPMFRINGHFPKPFPYYVSHHHEETRD